MPYRLNDERMEWMKSLFNEPHYDVTRLPGYEVHIAANPFIAFHDLPVKSRYRFMLEESEYIIRGFIKGPVCRGQVALNVIDDQSVVIGHCSSFQSVEMKMKTLRCTVLNCVVVSRDTGNLYHARSTTVAKIATVKSLDNRRRDASGNYVRQNVAKNGRPHDVLHRLATVATFARTW